MMKRIERLYRRVGIELYWYLITLLLLLAAVLYLNHLRTGVTPSRVFIHISALNFDIFWYGLCIVGGIALGSYVVSHLAGERAQMIFEQVVPKAVRNQRIQSWKLPSEIQKLLAKQKIRTVGSMLLSWGFDPRMLGLNQAGMERVRQRLQATKGVKADWLSDAPWRPWNPEHVWNGIVWCLIPAVIGARLYHVLTPSPSMAALGINTPLDYFRHPYQLINLRNGGLGIYGGIAGGALGLLIYARRQRLPALAWADLAAIGVALGQVFGRWGNFFNQELYGAPSNLPWAITIDPAYRLPQVSEFSRFHPAFLYESLWSFVTFVVLLTLYRRYSDKLLTGDLTALYLVFYAIGRIMLETVRLDSRLLNLGGLQLNMAVATFVSLVVAVLMILWRVQQRLRAKA
ncbi:MAG: prolipoprotein diacylglyceryl transferase [Anaerolineae bacterium]